MYTITLNDGTKLSNLELNGNNFIATEVLADSVFQGKLSSVTFTDGKTTKTYKDMVLMSNIVNDGRSWFILAEKTAQVKATEKMSALLEATANSITDVQIALAEVYEMMISIGGV